MLEHADDVVFELVLEGEVWVQLFEQEADNVVKILHTGASQHFLRHLVIGVVVVLQEVEQRADAATHEGLGADVAAVDHTRSQRTTTASHAWFPV